MRLPSCMILFVVLSITLSGKAYRILGIFPFNGKSHFVMFGRLMKGLAERGHQVDVMSHFPLKKPIPNYNDTVSFAGTLPDLVNNMTWKMVERLLHAPGSEPSSIPNTYGNDLCHYMKYPKFKNLIDNPPKNPAYDLVITEIFGANCFLAMGQHLKVPVVGISTPLMFPWVNDMAGNPDNPAYIPNVFSDFNYQMNFWQRVMNTLLNFKVKRLFNQASEKQTHLMKKYLGPDAPSIREAERNVSLILVNSYFSLNGVRPFTAAVVEVGGLHIDDKEVESSNDLQKWLDDSVHGFIYISFGSMMTIESFPGEVLNALYTSLAKLAPIRVLMKIARAEELPSGLPSNVRTYPWLSQLAVLRHKNIRAFMTHGGLMGTQEAVYYGVPMIGVPFFGDQEQNIKLYVQNNLAVALHRNKLSVKELDAAFNAVLYDLSYMKAAKKMSSLFRDRPMSALDTAIFWIEYVIRNGGKNLRSPAMDLAWWQVQLLDVYGLLTFVTALTVCSLLFMVKKLKAVFCLGNQRLTKESKKVK